MEDDEYVSDYEKEETEDSNSELHDTERYVKSEFEPVPKGKELKNKTFLYYEIREIENNNAVLMKKVMAQADRQRQYKISNYVQPKKSSAEINRKKKQRQTDHDNLVLLKKIQAIKSFGLSKPKSCFLAKS